MLADIFGFFLIVVAVFALILQRLYSSTPAKELKRLAARDEPLAQQIYRPVAYGATLQVLLWGIAGVGLSAGLWLLIASLPAITVVVLFALIFGGCAIALPRLRFTRQTRSLVAMIAPMLEWLVRHTHPLLNALTEKLYRHRLLMAHSGMYEKEDLDALLVQQQGQEDNRIDPNEIELVRRAFQFSEAKAADVALLRKDVMLVSTSDPLGPVFLDELHTSGQEFFPVFRGTPDNVVGLLSMYDASQSRNTGQVADIMREKLCFVGEDFSLPQVARAFATTGQPVALVVNKFEEFVGILTFGQLMGYLFAAQLNSERPEPAYEDAAAVAAFSPQPDALYVDSPASPDVSEVVE